MGVQNVSYVLTSELNNSALKKLNLTKNEVEEAVQKVLEWLKNQPHLQNVKPDDRQIECLFVRSKGSIERTIQGLDQYYALKTQVPQLFMNRDPLQNDFMLPFKSFSCTIQDPVSSSGDRVLCMKCHPDVSQFQVYDLYKIMLMFLEIKTRLDYANDYIFVFDYSNVTFEHVKKISLEAMKNTLLALQGPFLLQLKGFHVVNSPKTVKPFLALFRSLLQADLKERIFIHQNLESLHAVVDRSLLPADFGGSQKPMKETEDIWYHELVNWRDWFVEEEEYTSDESKKPVEGKPDEFLGRKVAVH